MSEKTEIDVEKFIRTSKKSRSTAVIGLVLAFIASAFSIFTANASSNSENNTLMTVTVILWIAALAGMGMWVLGRRAFHKASARGGWLAQSAEAPALGNEWGGWILVFPDPSDAEEIYGQAVRNLRNNQIGFPIRIDLSWLRTEEEGMKFAVAFFYPAGEEQTAVARLRDMAQDWAGSITGARLLSGETAREEYFRTFQGCGSCVWLE